MNNTIQGETPLNRFLLKVIEWGTYLILLSPLVVNKNYYFPFVAPKSLFFMALSEIIIAAWLILILHSKKYRPKLNFVLIAILLFFLSMIISSILGVSFDNSFWSKFERMSGLLMFFHLIGLFLVLSSTFKEKKQWNNFFLTNVLVGLIVSVISFISRGTVDGMIFAAKGGATIGNSSFLGTYLLFSSFFALYLFFHSKQKIKIFSAVSVVLMVIAMWLSGARAATASFLGGIALISLLYFSFVSKKGILNKLGKIAIIGGSILIIFSGFLVFREGSFVQDKFIQLTTRSRLVVWESAMKSFQDKPLFGWGPDNFDFAFLKNFNSCMPLSECGGEVWFDKAHNIIIDTLVTTGIVGLLTYLSIFVSVFVLLFKKFKEDKISFWTFSIFGSLLVAYFIQNLTVFDMISSYLVFFLSLAFISSLGNDNGEDVSFETKPFAITFILILLIISFFSFIIGPDKAARLTIQAIVTKNPEERIEYYQESVKASPLGDYQTRELFAQTTLDLLMDNENYSTATQAKEELTFLIGELEKTRENNPYDFRSIMRLGELYGRLYLIDGESITLAEERLEEAISLSPTNQQGYWNLAQIKIFKGDYITALEIAKEAISLNDKVFDSYSIAIQIANAMGEIDERNRLIEEALKIDQSWEEKLIELFN